MSSFPSLIFKVYHSISTIQYMWLAVTIVQLDAFQKKKSWIDTSLFVKRFLWCRVQKANGTPAERKHNSNYLPLFQSDKFSINFKEEKIPPKSSRTMYQLTAISFRRIAFWIFRMYDTISTLQHSMTSFPVRPLSTGQYEICGLLSHSCLSCRSAFLLLYMTENGFQKDTKW